MDLENQKRVKDFAEQYGPENVVVVLGAAEGEAAGLAAETVTAGDPTFAGPLAGVQLGLTVYHICEDEIKAEGIRIIPGTLSVMADGKNITSKCQVEFDDNERSYTIQTPIALRTE